MEGQPLHEGWYNFKGENVYVQHLGDAWNYYGKQGWLPLTPEDSNLCIPLTADQVETMINARPTVTQLVEAYDDYLKLLGDEINDMTSIMMVHGWKSHRYEEGVLLREKIQTIKHSLCLMPKKDKP